MWRSSRRFSSPHAVDRAAGCPGSRVSRIRQAGFVVCVSSRDRRVRQVDRQGTIRFDVDFCAPSRPPSSNRRAIRYQPVASIDLFQRSSDIDIVSRR